jgi:hypothetical protein
VRFVIASVNHVGHAGALAAQCGSAAPWNGDSSDDVALRDVGRGNASGAARRCIGG